MQTYNGAKLANMQRRKSCKHSKAQNMHTYKAQIIIPEKVAYKTCKYAKGQKMQTRNGAKHANIPSRKRCKHEKAQNMQTL